MTYRQRYWKQFREQLWICVKILWHGVIRDEGHHSNWGKTWFFKNSKSTRKGR